MADRVARRIQVHGHRGARARYPENTLTAFRYAIQEGVDFLELDVLATQDDVLVVTHDPRIDPMLFTGGPPGVAIRELTLAALLKYDCGALPNPRFPHQQTVPGTRVPALDQVLSLAASSVVGFNIEVKSFPDAPQLTPAPAAYANLLLARIQAFRVESRVIVQSFDFRILHEVKRLAPEIRLAALWEGSPRSFAKIAREAQATMVAVEVNLVTPEAVQEAHDAGYEVAAWTANTAVEWRKLQDAGVDAIISDDPASLIAYLNKS